MCAGSGSRAPPPRRGCGPLGRWRRPRVRVELVVADAHPDDPLTGGVGQEPLDRGLVPDLDVGEVGDPPPDGPFEQGTRHGRPVEHRLGASLHATGLLPVEVSTEVEIDGTGDAKLVSEAGEPRLEKPRAGDEEQVGVAALGHQPAGLRGRPGACRVRRRRLDRTGLRELGRRRAPPCWRRARPLLARISRRSCPSPLVVRATTAS